MIHMINHVSAVQVNTTVFPKKQKKNVARVLKESPFEVERMYFFSRTHTSLDIKCRCCPDYAQIHSGEGDSASRRKKRGGAYVATPPPLRFVSFVQPWWDIALPSSRCTGVMAQLASREPLGVLEGALEEAYRVKRVGATCWERSAKLAEVEGRGGDGTGHHLWLVTRLKKPELQCSFKEGRGRSRAPRRSTKRKKKK